MVNRITPGSSSPSIRIFVLRSGSPATITSSEPGLLVEWRRSLEGIPLSGTATTLSVSDLSTINQAHTSGGLKVVDAATGEHRLDLHSAASVAGADGIDLFMSATDTNLLFVVPPITLQEPALAEGAEMDLVDAPNAAAVGVIQSGLATPTNIIAGTITTVTNLTNLPSMPTDWLTAAGLSNAAIAKIEAALLNEGDGQALIDAIVQAIDTADIENDVLPALIRDAILNRVLAGNHDTAGTPGKILQEIIEDTGTTIPASITAASLSQQNVRDAMKLAPTAGSPATGSVDAHLDTIEAGGGGGGTTVNITTEGNTITSEAG